ncbi:Thimet oligopeptidase (Endopeptidase 24.15) (MP78), partial [Durusdinium trenchii]
QPMFCSITRPPLLRRLSLRLGPHSSSPACGAWQRARSVGRPPPRCGSTAALSLGAAAVLARAGRARGWKQRMASAGASTIGAHQLNFCKSAEEIRSSLRSLISRYEAEVQAIVDADDRSFAATFGRLADADGLAALFSAELTLPAQVSGEKAVRDASADAKAQLQQMWSKSYARADLYHALEAAAGLAAGSEEQRLVEVVLAKLRHVGAHLPEAQRKELEELDQQCGKLCLQAEQNINEDCSSVDLTPADLEGCAESFVESLPSTEAGLKRCALKAPTLVPILQRCKSSATRRRMMEASQRKCIEVNTPVLEELIAARHTAAVKLGFSCHAERMLASKMAGNLKTAKGFVEEMLQRLRPLRDRDLSL